jgi:hypothetical protein
MSNSTVNNIKMGKVMPFFKFLKKFVYLLDINVRLCHGSGDYPLALHLRDLGSIAGYHIRGLLWMKQQWDRYFSEYFGFSLSLLYQSTNVP